MRQITARIHIGLAWLIFLGGCLALYLIAVSVFGGGSAAAEGAFGRMLFLLSLLMLIVSLVCRSSKLNVGLSVLVPILFFVQGIFVYLPPLPPTGRAIHALNGLVIMGICYVLANGRVRASVKSEQSATDAASASSYQAGD